MKRSSCHVSHVRRTDKSGVVERAVTQCNRRLSKMSWKACDQVPEQPRSSRDDLRTCAVQACENGSPWRARCSCPWQAASSPPQVTFSMELDCIIVGGGPAGLTAATYLRRLHRHVVVFDDGRSRARWIPESHNCPGFPLGVSGTELLRRLRDQAAAYGATGRSSRVKTIRQVEGGWEAEADDGACSAPTILLATGVVDRLPSLASGEPEEALRSGLLRSCALCDGFEATDHRLAVVGPLVRAAANARYMTTFSADVTVVPIEEHADTAVLPDTEGLTILPNLRSLVCRDDGWDLTDAAGGTYRFDFVYAAMGAPARGELARQLGAELNDEGAVVTDDHMETSLPGLYAIGDVVTDLNQIAVAFGHAAIAASAIHRSLPARRRLAGKL